MRGRRCAIRPQASAAPPPGPCARQGWGRPRQGWALAADARLSDRKSSSRRPGKHRQRGGVWSRTMHAPPASPTATIPAQHTDLPRGICAEQACTPRGPRCESGPDPPGARLQLGGRSRPCTGERNQGLRSRAPGPSWGGCGGGGAGAVGSAGTVAQRPGGGDEGGAPIGGRGTDGACTPPCTQPMYRAILRGLLVSPALLASRVLGATSLPHPKKCCADVARVGPAPAVTPADAECRGAAAPSGTGSQTGTSRVGWFPNRNLDRRPRWHRDPTDLDPGH